MMKLAICGPGRAGKDTVSNWLKANTVLRYYGSTSEAATALCFEKMQKKYGYSCTADAFNDRHNHREEWAEIIWAYNNPYGITLYADMLKESDILNGIRRKGELQALRERLMIDLVIWIDRDVPTDPSLEMDSGVADIIINNNGSLEDLYAKLTRLTRNMRILK